MIPKKYSLADYEKEKECSATSMWYLVIRGAARQGNSIDPKLQVGQSFPRRTQMLPSLHNFKNSRENFLIFNFFSHDHPSLQYLKFATESAQETRTSLSYECAHISVASEWQTNSSIASEVAAIRASSSQKLKRVELSDTLSYAGYECVMNDNWFWMKNKKRMYMNSDIRCMSSSTVVCYHDILHPTRTFPWVGWILHKQFQNI